MVEEDAAATLDRVPPVDLDTQTPLLHLRSGGVSLLLQLSPTALPVVRHWGADLGDLAGRADPWMVLDAVEPLFCLIPEPSDTWRADPALSGTREGEPTAWAVAHCQTRLFSETELTGGVVEVGPDTVIVEAEDPVAAAHPRPRHSADRHRRGLLPGRDHQSRRSSPTGWTGSACTCLPGTARPTRSRWTDPRSLRYPSRSGALSSDSDGGEPAQLLVGEPWAGFQRGQVWQAHVAFSGAVSHRCVTAGGRSYLGGGERLAAGEVVLGQEESYHSPWVLWSWGARAGCGRRPAASQRPAGGRPARAGDLRCDRAGLRPSRPAGHADAGRVRGGGRGGGLPARSSAGAYAPGSTRTQTTTGPPTPRRPTIWPGCSDGSASSIWRSGWPSSRSGSTRVRRSSATIPTGCSPHPATAWSSRCSTCPSDRRWSTSGSG